MAMQLKGINSSQLPDYILLDSNGGLYPGEVDDPTIEYDPVAHEFPMYPHTPAYLANGTLRIAEDNQGATILSGLSTWDYQKNEYGQVSKFGTLFKSWTQDTFWTDESDLAKCIRKMLFLTKADLNFVPESSFDFVNGLFEVDMTTDILADPFTAMSHLSGYDISYDAWISQFEKLLPEDHAAVIRKFLFTEGLVSENGKKQSLFSDIYQILRFSKQYVETSSSAIGSDSAGCFIPTMCWTNHGRGGFIFARQTATTTTANTTALHWQFGTMEMFGLSDETAVRAYSTGSGKIFGHAVAYFYPTANTAEELTVPFVPRKLETVKPDGFYFEAPTSSRYLAVKPISENNDQLVAITRVNNNKTLGTNCQSGAYTNTAVRNEIVRVKTQIITNGILLSSPHQIDIGTENRVTLTANIADAQYPYDVFPIEGYHPQSSHQYWQEFEAALAEHGCAFDLSILYDANVQKNCRLANRPTIKRPPLVDLFSIFSQMFFYAKSNALTQTQSQQLMTCNISTEGRLIAVQMFENTKGVITMTLFQGVKGTQATASHQYTGGYTLALK